MVVADKIKCDCGALVKDPTHHFHTNSKGHQTWLAFGKVTSEVGDAVEAATFSPNTETGFRRGRIEPEPLHENLQAALDTFSKEKNPGVRIERRAQMAAKLLRTHFKMFELPNEEHPETISDILRQLNIPILDERTGEVPEGFDGK